MCGGFYFSRHVLQLLHKRLPPKSHFRRPITAADADLSKHNHFSFICRAKKKNPERNLWSQEGFFFFKMGELKVSESGWNLFLMGRYLARPPDERSQAELKDGLDSRRAATGTTFQRWWG